MMSRGFSLWLDVLRVLAAFAVFLGHFAHEKFTRGDYQVLRDWNIGPDAVVVFFVLSGLVIAYAAERDRSGGHFAFNRVTRLLTVMLPAILLTLAFDAMGTRLAPEAYTPYFYAPIGAGEALVRGLTFTNEWVGAIERVRLGSNGALWSLSYEATYYAMFGIAIFCRGATRIVLILALALAAGLPILALMPCWLAGVALWHLIKGERAGRLSQPRAYLFALGGPVALVAFKALGVPELLSALTAAAVAPASHHALLTYSDEMLWSYILTLCVVFHLFGMARLLAGRSVDQWSRPARVIRWLAGGSFSLYVVHYPTLHLLDAALPAALPLSDLTLLALSLGIAFAFAAMFERPLGRYRAAVRGIGAAIRPATATR